MTDESNHELLSAYLDGELAPDERRRVEQLLAENAECRQVYEELRALRASLSSLPRHKLDADIGQRVIRIAEQTILGKARMPGAEADSREEGAPIESATGEDATNRGMSAADRKSRAWRAIAYPILAVAAAVAMMLNAPKDKVMHDRQLADAAGKRAPHATLSASAPTDQSAEATPLALDSYSMDERLDRSPDDSISDHDLMEKDAESTKDHRAGAGAKRGANSHLAGQIAADKAEPIDESINLYQTEGPSGQSGPGMRKPGDESALKAKLAISPATLVIRCKLAPAAVDGKAFDALLARNHLVALPAATGPETKTKAAREEQPAPAGNAPVPPQGRPEPDDLTRKRIVNETRSHPGQAWSKSVIVELDSRQLVALLADLQKHPDQFLSVELPAGSDDESDLSTERLNADVNGNHFYGRNGYAADGKSAAKAAARPAPPAEAAEPAADTSAAGSATVEPAAGDSADSGSAADRPVRARDLDVRWQNIAPSAGEANRPARVRVLFRLSAAAGD